MQSGSQFVIGEAKSAGNCRLFGRLSDSTKGCRTVLHSDNKNGRLRPGGAP